MNKIREIIESWIISFNPNEDQKRLGEKRYEICLGCEHYGKSRPVTGDEYCKKCLCPIQKKIFSQQMNDSCPLKKWDAVEEEFRKEKLKNDKYRML